MMTMNSMIFCNLKDTVRLLSGLLTHGSFRRLNLIIATFLLSFLGACTDSAPNVFSGNRSGITCIAPDDFGYTKMSVSSLGYNVPDNPANQYSEWLRVGTLYSGGSVAIYAYGPDYISTSAWFPFYGNAFTFSQLMNDTDNSTPPVSLYPQCIGTNPSVQPNDYNIVSNCYLPKADNSSNQMQCPNLISCDYCNPNDVTAPFMTLANVVTTPGQILNATVISPQDGSQITNVRKFSCYFTQGAGAYLLTVPSNGDGHPVLDPNSDPSYIKDYRKIPGATVTNLYPPSNGGSLYNTNGVSVGGFQGELATSSTSTGTGDQTSGNILSASFGDVLYVKIMDNYYSDNIGDLAFDIKTGDTKIGPIQMFLEFMIDELNTFTSTIFINLVKNPDYVMVVRSVMTLYITITGLLFSVGIVQITQKEMLIRTFKVVLVTALLTGASSWKFFNDYFFNLFTAGYIEFTALVTGVFTGVSVKGDPVGSLSFFDKLLDLFFCPETTFKIWSLFFHDFVGIYMIPIIYAGIFMFIKVIAETAVYYIMTYMVICLLICMGPIFIMFILFAKTKAIFDNWINQMASYLIQGIFYISALTMMTIIILTEFFKVIGYRICWVNLFSIFGQNIFNFFIPCYFGSSKCPGYLTNFGSDERVQTISIPGWSFGQNADNTLDFTTVYQPYQHSGSRNIDFPFLDPNGYGYGDVVISDKTLLSQLSSGEFGGIAHIGEGLIFLIVTMLGVKFMEIVPQMAKAVSGTSGSVADIKGASHQAFNNMKGVAKGAAQGVKKSAGYIGGKAMAGLRKTMSGLGKATGTTDLVKNLDEKLTNKYGKKYTYTKTAISLAAKGTKFLAKAAFSVHSLAMYSAIHGEMHPKLRDANTNPLKALQNKVQMKASKLKGDVKQKLTPKFITEMQERQANFDKKWDDLVRRAQAPLAKPFDKVMGQIEKLQEAASGERMNRRSLDSDEAVKKHFGDPDIFEKDPNARIKYITSQADEHGRPTKEAAEVKAFLDAIDNQRAMSREAQKLKDGEHDPHDKFKECEGDKGFDYTKAVRAYANDIYADQSLIPEALKRYAVIDKPDEGPLAVRVNDLAEKQKESTDAAAMQMQATIALQQAYTSGDQARISAAAQELSEAATNASKAYKAATDAQLQLLEEQKHFAREQAKYDILMENVQGAIRDVAPIPPDHSGLPQLQQGAQQDLAFKMNADQKYLAAWNSYQENSQSPEAAKALHDAAAMASSYYNRAQSSSYNYYKAQSVAMIDNAKYEMLSDIYQVKKGKEGHDY